MAVVGGLPVYCPRLVYGEVCGKEMELLCVSDGSEFDKDWCHAYYYCPNCKRSLMVTRSMTVVQDQEERI